MKKKKPESRSFFIFAAISTAFFVLFLFVKRDNVIRWIQAGSTIREQEERIVSLKNDISEMEHRHEALISDRDTLEQYARERFLFAQPGEDVYLTDE